MLVDPRSEPLVATFVREPAYACVPTDYQGNMALRAKLYGRAKRSRRDQQELWMLCKRDLLLYVSLYCWLYEPRNAGGKAIPFIPYPYQEHGLIALRDAILNGHDIVEEKSRDMGGTWMPIVVIDWFARFHDLNTFLLLSRKEDLVDRTNDPDTLFGKLDFLHNRLPKFLQGDRQRTDRHIGFGSTGSTIDGESTNTDAGRGGRRTAIFADEAPAMPNLREIDAATLRNSNCRIWCGTPQPGGLAFQELATGGQVPKITLHWSVHPLYNEGIYRDETGKLRSPWYDAQCKRVSHPAIIAQELDIDYVGANMQFFSGPNIASARRHIKPPVMIGDVTVDHERKAKAEFVERDRGPMRLWCVWPPPKSSYVMGIDVASGSANIDGRGASNSVIAVVDEKSGEKVAEYANHAIQPYEFARICSGVSRAFCNAFVIWEQNGPGRGFGTEIMRCGISNIYYRTREESVSKKQQDIPGWWPTTQNKYDMLVELRKAIIEGWFLDRSSAAIEELASYIQVGPTEIVHAKQVGADPSGARDNHGDRVIANGLAVWVVKDRIRDKAEEVEEEEVFEPGTIGWRRGEADRERRVLQEAYW